MAKRVSIKPASFTNEREGGYWHSAQDIAFRSGASLVLRDGATWLVSEEGERLLCEPQQPERVWFETWLIMRQEFPALARLWIGGRALTKPGETV